MAVLHPVLHVVDHLAARASRIIQATRGLTESGSSGPAALGRFAETPRRYGDLTESGGSGPCDYLDGGDLAGCMPQHGRPSRES